MSQSYRKKTRKSRFNAYFLVHSLALTHAGVAELVDAHDSKSCSARSVGSIPNSGNRAAKIQRV